MFRPSCSANSAGEVPLLQVVNRKNRVETTRTIVPNMGVLRSQSDRLSVCCIPTDGLSRCFMNSRIEKGVATRQHIVGVATRLFTKSGFEATSIEAILSACAISRGALYHHFASKDELFLAVFEAIEREIAQATIAAARDSIDP